MSFIRYFDFFDVRFHFYTNSQPKNRSNFGGLMSIIFIISSFILFIILEYDEIQQISPLTSKSEIPEIVDRTIQLDKEKIWIPWRIVNYEEKFINYSGLLYPIITLVEGRKNNNNEMKLKYKILKYNLCNETSMATKNDHFKLNIKLNEIFCIDENEIPFGGSWDSDYIYFLEINLYLCKDGIDFNITDERCTNFSKLIENENNTGWIFEFYYPLVQFEPTNLQNPMSTIYRRYYYILSSHANKVERVYLQENILNDDLGIIKSIPKNYSYWGMSEFFGDSYFFSVEKDNLTKVSTSRLYSLVIFLDMGLIYYTRHYKKLFGIFAEYFPYLNIIYYVMKTFTKIIKLSFTRKSLVELVFENEPIIKNQDKNNNNLKPSDKSLNNNINATINNFIKNGKNKKELFADSELNKINKIQETKKTNNEQELNSDQPNNKSPIERKRTLETFVKNKFLINFNIKKQHKKQKTNIKEKENKESSLFPFIYYLLPFHTRSKKYENFLIVRCFMSKLYDISSHIILFKHFNIMKNIFLEERNLRICNKKINIQNKELMKEVKNEVNDYSRENKYFVFFKSLLEYD